MPIVAASLLLGLLLSPPPLQTYSWHFGCYGLSGLNTATWFLRIIFRSLHIVKFSTSLHLNLRRMWENSSGADVVWVWDKALSRGKLEEHTFFSVFFGEIQPNDFGCWFPLNLLQNLLQLLTLLRKDFIALILWWYMYTCILRSSQELGYFKWSPLPQT